MLYGLQQLSGPAGSELAAAILDPALPESMRELYTSPDTAVWAVKTLDGHTGRWYPAWGAYKVQACQAGGLAEIWIWAGLTISPAVNGMAREYQTVSIQLAYSGDNWKVTENDSLPDTGVVCACGSEDLTLFDPGATLHADTPTPPPAAEVTRVLSSAHPGWQQYSDAPKN